MFGAGTDGNGNSDTLAEGGYLIRHLLHLQHLRGGMKWSQCQAEGTSGRRAAQHYDRMLPPSSARTFPEACWLAQGRIRWLAAMKRMTRSSQGTLAPDTHTSSPIEMSSGSIAEARCSHVGQAFDH